MKTKYFLIFLAIAMPFVAYNKACAQKCLVLDYDADGNRVYRYVVDNCLESKDIAEVEETEIEEEIGVFPNPNSGCFKIIVPADKQNSTSYYELYDVNGMKITVNNLRDKVTDVDIGNMPAGIYLLKIMIGDNAFSKVILKQ